jgi:hypothetical protein
VAIDASTMPVVAAEHLPALTRECPQLTEIFVHTMVDRARAFTSNALHDEKMASSLPSVGRLFAMRDSRRVARCGFWLGSRTKG